MADERYFLETPRIGFRCWRDSDLGLAYELWGDERVTEWIGGPLTLEETRARLEVEIEMERLHGLQYWPIFLRGDAGVLDEIHLGCCGLRPYRLEESIHELGFHLRPEHWGRGYAREGARAVIDHAFENLGAAALFAGHHPENRRSGRILRGLGFQYRADEFYPPTGLDHPSYLLRREDL